MAKENVNEIGNALRLIRTVENLQQAELAKLLKITAVSLSNLERGKTQISNETAIRLYFVLQKLLERKEADKELESIQIYAIREVKEKVIYPKIRDILEPDID